MKSAPESKLFSTNKTLRIRDRLLDLRIPVVMGVLNVTPDSFFDGAKYDQDEAIIKQVAKMLQEGASIIDVGAYSSRPGARDIPVDEEVQRAVHAIKLILRTFPHTLISIDTFRSSVAHAAIQEGASMINDISAGALDPMMIETVAHAQVPYVCMHMRGNPQSMKDLTAYDNLLKEVTDYFHAKIHALHAKGIKDVVIDPGFGFAKTSRQGLSLLNELDYLKILGKPILVGLSRKSMIWKTLETDASNALNGTTVLNTIAVLKGASILRVHDVREAIEVIKLVHAVHPPSPELAD